MNPIKRVTALKPLSREHHHGLLFCWKIRKGLKKGVELERIKNYSDFFFQQQLKPHFKDEEIYLFPLLGNSHPLVKKALQHHRKLNKLFKQKEELLKALSGIEELLDKHIRFEERELFMIIQDEVNIKDLCSIEGIIDKEIENLDHKWADKFWE